MGSLHTKLNNLTNDMRNVQNYLELLVNKHVPEEQLRVVAAPLPVLRSRRQRASPVKPSFSSVPLLRSGGGGGRNLFI
jgi:hypothetical protein